MQPESTLNQLRESLPSGQLPSSYGVYFKNTLVALCHALEDHILQNCSDDPDQKPLVLVTFQRGKWYLQEAERYLDIARCSSDVAIAAVPDSGFAEHEAGQLDNVSMVHLDPDDELVNEWNLIILAPGYASMVLCHELTDADYLAQNQPGTDIERKFYGLWTFDRDQVAKTTEILIERMRPYNEPLAEQLLVRYQQIQGCIDVAPVDLSGVVSRIVSYLQSSQEQLVTVSRQTREFWGLEGQAVRMNRNLAANKLQAFLRMAQRVDERDSANPVASLQVSALSETLGQMLDLPTIKLRRLRLAGLLFRVGLSEAPPEVFTRLASDLDCSTRVLWKDRVVLGAQLLGAMPELEPIAKIIRHQREHWDGTGRPDGLKGEEIPIEARILGLVARFQELTQTRGDRPALGLNDALEKCKYHSGKRYEPNLVETLGNVVRLTEMGLMQLPTQPSQVPKVWLEDAPLSSSTSTEKKS
ncbi:MAG: HD domain-containing phosphohydrolase [Thermosynechococcaceae cyanobacterium]